MSASAFCPVPHTRRDQVWLAVGLGLGLAIRHLYSSRRLRFRSAAAKLYYWPATGKAETIRLLMAELGIAWEDVTFAKPAADFEVYASGSTMATLKKSQPAQDFFARCRAMGGNATTNTPLLELDGQRYTQSTAIYRVLARRGGLLPEEPGAAYVVDAVLAHVEDAFPLCYQALRGDVTKEKLANELAPTHLGNLERLLGQHGGVWFTGAFSVADLRVFDVLTHLFERSLPGCLAPYPLLSGLVTRVRERPRVARYLASAQYAATDKFHAL